MRFGVTLALANPGLWPTIAEEADGLGFESIWISDHLVLPVEMSGGERPGEEHRGLPPETPVFDPWVALAFMAARTERIRLGIPAYNLALRHPFVAARAVATL